MMNNEYYIVSRENNDNYPLLKVMKGGKWQKGGKYVNPDEIETMFYKLGKPIPKKTIMVDYHSSPYSVISDKIVDILDRIDIKGIQFIPATVTGKDDELFENYYFLNIYNNLAALDKENSIYEWMDTINVASPIEKLVLNEDILSKVPLEDRLIFRLTENLMFEVFHISIVEKIMSTSPKGIKFTKVSDWTIGTPFE